MIPAMDLTLVQDLAKRMPGFMAVWGHPDIAQETLARATDLYKAHNADPANVNKQWNLPAKVVSNRGLPGFTVFAMNTPAQEQGLKNVGQLANGSQVAYNRNTGMGTSVSNMPVSRFYEICFIGLNELDAAEFQRAIWFSWAKQPLEVKFRDANNQVFTHTCPKFVISDPIFSFETVDSTATQLLYKINWTIRLDGHWLNSRMDPIVLEIQNTYSEIILEGNPVILLPLEQQILTPEDYEN